MQLYNRGQESVSEAVCREFSDSDGKVRINTPEKAKRYMEILRGKGYKPIEGKQPRNELLNTENEAL